MKKILGLLCVALLIVSCSSKQEDVAADADVNVDVVEEEVIQEETPQKVEGYYEQGLQAEKDGQYEQAIEFFSKELEENKDIKDEDKAVNLINIGYCYGKLNDFDKEFECYDKALKIIPDFPPTIFALGEHYYNKKDLDNALKMYEKVVEAIPTFGEAYYKLALVQKDLGNDELSMINMKKAADLRDPEALKFLEQTAQ